MFRKLINKINKYITTENYLGRRIPCCIQCHNTFPVLHSRGKKSMCPWRPYILSHWFVDRVLSLCMSSCRFAPLGDQKLHRICTYGTPVIQQQIPIRTRLRQLAELSF